MTELDREKYSEATDSTLVDWVLGGDSRAFEYLVERYSDTINRLLSSRLNGDSAHEVEDLMQESFIKAYINLHRYDSRYTFGQWIYTIARNTSIDYQRRRQDEQSLDETLATPPEERSPNPEQSIINSQKRTEIEEGVAQLSPRHQELFKMRFLDEYSYEEIAEKLSMPIGTVKTNIHRARAHMCRFIADREEL